MNNFLPTIVTSASQQVETEAPVSGIGDHRGSAWENLAHELRQPLSVIESLAYYLELTSKDDGACAHLRQIQSMVHQANRILMEESAHQASRGSVRIASQ
jgi:signal transduction histidine kinase